jgi:Peptidoglycan-binding protein, CsiV
MNHAVPRPLYLALLALLLASLPAASQQSPSRYDVEIVVFRMAGNPGPEDLNVASAPVSATGGMQVTPTTQRRLTEEVSRLQAAGGFQVLAHTAWTQAPAAWNSRHGVSAAQLGLEESGISGTVFIERGQYLHLGIDLRVDQGGHVYTISEVRRVRPGEAQYFDHPFVGILALISPAG